MRGNSARHGARQTCLVIEDSAVDRARITRALSQRGSQLELHFTQSLQEARKLLETLCFQMIILDNNLPDGMGADFALELAQHPRHSKSPVLMFSDWPSPFMWDKARKAGVSYILNKADFHFDYVRRAMEQTQQRLH